MKAELYNFRGWINTSDPENLKSDFQLVLKEVEFEVLGFIEHHFKPYGYTCIWLLGESHFAIHTYPEHNTAYIELTSCAKEKNKQFEKRVDALFTVKSTESSVLCTRK